MTRLFALSLLLLAALLGGCAGTPQGLVPSESSAPSGTQETRATESSTTQDDRFGLSLNERMTVYWEMYELSYQANAEAYTAYPIEPSSEDPDETAEARRVVYNTYLDEHRTALLHEYGLTEDELDEVILEGFRFQWPAPEPASYGDG